MKAPMPTLLRGDARTLALAENTVDLIVTSPSYFGLRSYQDGGQHCDGQVGAEATPTEFVDALIACTQEWMRVLKPTGSLFINLGDGYASRSEGFQRGARDGVHQPWVRPVTGVTPKSLFGIPWRYAIRCVDELGLVLRQELIWTSTSGTMLSPASRTITGYACACPDTSAAAAPGVVLDPFGGTGTTALVATMLGRRGISVDLSADYCRLARWRSSDPKERARAAGLDPDQVSKIVPSLPGQLDMFGEAS